eukprot:Skav231808  [mRNA]  locus=scaffold692:226843:232856:- [translate_table: standard]
MAIEVCSLDSVKPADVTGISGEEASLEEEVLALLLARDDVKSSIELAEEQGKGQYIFHQFQLSRQEGQVEDATASLLGILQDLLGDRKRSQEAEAAEAAEAVKRPRVADESWLEECSRAAKPDRGHLEGRSRARVAARRDEIVAVDDGPTEPVPLFWRVDLPEVLKVLSQRGVLPSNFLPVKPHVTLLYLGGDLPEQRAAARSSMGLQQFRNAKQALEKLKGRSVAVKMTEIIIEENVACALVELPKGVPCAVKIPHLTLGTRENVPARHANEILEEIVNANRTQGITRIKLPKPKERWSTSWDLRSSR